MGQLCAYAAFAAVIAFLSTDPAYQRFDPDKAQIKLSLRHAADRVGECRRLTPEEIAALPANMRRPLDCPRERLPILVEIEVDGALLYSGTLPPAGLAGDGAATVYKLFDVEPGTKRIVARLRDSARDEGFDYEGSAEVDLRPRQNFVIDFKADRGGFLFM